MAKATRADRAKTRAPLELQDGGYYWVALDDGCEFNIRDFLGDGPHLVRLDLKDGDWTAHMLDRFRGIIDIGSDPTQRVARMAWPANGLMGATFDGQHLRITWLSKLGDPPSLPAEVDPEDATTTVWARSPEKAK